MRTAFVTGCIWVATTSVSCADEPIRRAIAFLTTEVPAWSRDNHCFSCHNNGDAARALYRAKIADPAIMAETTRWLTHPEEWEGQGVEGPSNDKRLARLQFALGLATAIETGASNARTALNRAADRVAGELNPDGSWPTDDHGLVGSPATYGKRLATALAIHVLQIDDPVRHAKLIVKAQSWIRSQPIQNVNEAAAVLLIEPMGREVTTQAGHLAMTFLHKAQSKHGGWGPYPNAPTEPFDTAIACLALHPFKSRSEIAIALNRGRAALIALQNLDGSWPATTRPSGGDSYAQTVSTSGWALMALLSD